MAWKIHEVFFRQFINSFKEAPQELILDFDATDDRVHGTQEGRAYHGYYQDWCFLPLYVFCGDQLLVSYLRPSNQDQAKHSWAILSLLVKALRKEWPQVKIILRADSGFCRWRMLRWCDAHQVDYVVGLAQNKRLLALVEDHKNQAAKDYQESGQKVRRFYGLEYGAKSWDKSRRVIAKIEHSSKGSNPRFVVTSLQAAPQEIYDGLYCQRGNRENRIKEQQLGLFADRTSCKRWWSNQLRLLFSSAAYILIEAMRRIGLKGSQMAKAQVQTIRLKLLKIGAVILRNTRRIPILMSSPCPTQDIFILLAQRFKAD